MRRSQVVESEEESDDMRTLTKETVKTASGSSKSNRQQRHQKSADQDSAQDPSSDVEELPEDTTTSVRSSMKPQGATSTNSQVDLLFNAP